MNPIDPHADCYPGTTPPPAAYAAESIAAACPPTGAIAADLAISPADTGEHSPWRIAADLARRAVNMLSPLRPEERSAMTPLRKAIELLDGSPRGAAIIDAMAQLDEASDQLSEIDRATVTHRVAQATRALRPAVRAAIEHRRAAYARAVAEGTAEGRSQFAAIAAALEADEAAERKAMNTESAA